MNLRNKILLTIAIPTFNRTVLLNKTLKSLLPQINEKIEVIIIDNASDVHINKNSFINKKKNTNYEPLQI